MDIGKGDHRSGTVLPLPAQVYHGTFAFPRDTGEMHRIISRVAKNYFRSLCLPVEHSLQWSAPVFTLHVTGRQRSLARWLERKKVCFPLCQTRLPFPQLQLWHSRTSLWPHDDSSSVYTTHFIPISKVLNANAPVKGAEYPAKCLNGLGPWLNIINSLLVSLPSWLNFSLISFASQTEF